MSWNAGGRREKIDFAYLTTPDDICSKKKHWNLPF